MLTREVATIAGSRSGLHMRSPGATRRFISAYQVGHTQARLDEWVEAVGDQWCVEFGQDPLHEAEMYRADDLAMFFGGLPKRALMQEDLPLPAGDNGLGRKADVV